MAKYPYGTLQIQVFCRRKKSHLYIGHQRELGQVQSQYFTAILSGELPQPLLREGQMTRNHPYSFHHLPTLFLMVRTNATEVISRRKRLMKYDT
jgi:hypothetical protein